MVEDIRKHTEASPRSIGIRVREKDVSRMEVSQSEVDEVLELFTPQSVLSQSVFPTPEFIHPSSIPDVKTLLSRREEIQYLRLLPLKTDEEYRRYHSYTKEQLAETVKNHMAEDEMVFVPNDFPDAIPPCVAEFLVWMRDEQKTDEEIALFVARVLSLLSVSSKHVILYERPLKNDTKFVRGSFSLLRHIHCWICTLPK